MTQHWSIRKTARRETQIARIGQLTGMGDNFAGVVDFALSYTFSQLQQEETMDRVEQVNWINELAEDILLYDMGEPSTPESLVKFYEDQGNEFPDWFDAHDRTLLVDAVEKAQRA